MRPPLDAGDAGREAAREAARRELADPRYHHQVGLLHRVLRWLLETVQDLLDAAAGGTQGRGLGLLVVAVLVTAVGVALLRRYGAPARDARSRAVFRSGARTVTAADHRARSAAAVASGDLSLAVLERFRAVARVLEERGAVPPRAARTAGEVAAEGGAVIPTAAGSLRDAARVFAAVAYGGRPGDADALAVVAAADEAATSTALVRVAAPAAVGGPA